MQLARLQPSCERSIRVLEAVSALITALFRSLALMSTSFQPAMVEWRLDAGITANELGENFDCKVTLHNQR